MKKFTVIFFFCTFFLTVFSKKIVRRYIFVHGTYLDNRNTWYKMISLFLLAYRQWRGGATEMSQYMKNTIKRRFSRPNECTIDIAGTRPGLFLIDPEKFDRSREEKEIISDFGFFCVSQFSLFSKYFLEDCTSDRYYIYNWSGTLDNRVRTEEAEQFLHALCQLQEYDWQHRKDDEVYHYYILCHSHGGTFALSMADHSEKDTVRFPLTLLFFGTPFFEKNELRCLKKIDNEWYQGFLFTQCVQCWAYNDFTQCGDFTIGFSQDHHGVPLTKHTASVTTRKLRNNFFTLRVSYEIFDENGKVTIISPHHKNLFIPPLLLPGVVKENTLFDYLLPSFVILSPSIIAALERNIIKDASDDLGEYLCTFSLKDTTDATIYVKKIVEEVAPSSHEIVRFGSAIVTKIITLLQRVMERIRNIFLKKEERTVDVCCEIIPPSLLEWYQKKAREMQEFLTTAYYERKKKISS